MRQKQKKYQYNQQNTTIDYSNYLLTPKGSINGMLMFVNWNLAYIIIQSLLMNNHIR